MKDDKTIKRRDGSRHQIRLLFDYPQIVSAFRQKIDSNQLPVEGDIKELIAVMAKTRYAKSQFWALRAAIPNRNAPFAKYATYEFLQPAVVSYIQGAISAKVLLVDTSLANQMCEFIRSLTKFIGVFHRRRSTKRFTERTKYFTHFTHHMVDSDIVRRIQFTVVARVKVFKQRGSCRSGSTQRGSLFGYALFLLLIGINWNEEESEDKHIGVLRGQRQLLHTSTAPCVRVLQTPTAPHNKTQHVPPPNHSSEYPDWAVKRSKFLIHLYNLMQRPLQKFMDAH
uniref:Uncharacterized protein n=1 Tax=Glossina palpalis gambiensis TaxID=67801 RepID=A0A1B0BLL2_9MUSC